MKALIARCAGAALIAFVLSASGWLDAATATSPALQGQKAVITWLLPPQQFVHPSRYHNPEVLHVHL